METDWKKKYEEAIKKVELLRGYSIEGNEKIDELFPELAESEDERIRREIIDFICWEIDRGSVTKEQREKSNSWLSYLERQKEQEKCPEYCVRSHCKGCPIYEKWKEQKPAEWSEQDIQYYDAVMDMITNALYLPCRPRDEVINWFKNLRPQPKIGWSEEDEKQIRQIERIVKNAGCSKMLQEKIHNWLKSLKNRGNFPKSNTNSPSWSKEDDAYLKWLCLIIHCQVVNKKMSLAEESELGNWINKWINHKPQSHWKPSDEQMVALLSELPVVKGSGDKVQNILESLYEDLKKLM